MVSLKNSFLVALLGLAVFIVNCQGEDVPPDMPLMSGIKKQDIDKCLTESGLTKDDLKHDDPPKEPTTKHMCFGKCLAKSAGYLKDDGTINSELLKNAIPPSVDAATASTMVKCMEDAGKVTTCEDMSKLMKCMPKPPKN